MFWRLPLYMYYIFSNIKNAYDTRFVLKMLSKLADGENEFYASRTSLWHDLAKHDLGKLNIATSCHVL